MDTEQSDAQVGTDLREKLLQCFKALNATGVAEITFEDLHQKLHQTYYSEGVGHAMNNVQTLVQLENLVSSNKVKSMERDGMKYFSLAASATAAPSKPKKSRPDAAPPLDDGMKEMSHIIGKCVKQINQVFFNFFVPCCVV